MWPDTVSESSTEDSPNCGVLRYCRTESSNSALAARPERKLENIRQYDFAFVPSAAFNVALTSAAPIGKKHNSDEHFRSQFCGRFGPSDAASL